MSEDGPSNFEVFAIDGVASLTIGPGCTRRDLPSRPGVRIWIVDMEPGAVWPRLDEHGRGGEDVLILSGEPIEGERRLGPGTYVKFAPNSAHRPRTDVGVRLYGFNLADDEGLAPAAI